MTAATKKLTGITVGSPIDLELQTPTSGIRLKAKLVGIDDPHLLIIKPISDSNWQNAKAFIQFGQPLIARLINEADFCELIAFRSQFNLPIGTPRNWMTIDYPLKVQTVTLRKQRRLSVSLDAMVVWERASRMLSVDAKVNDISPSGCGMTAQLPNQLNEGQKVTLTIFNKNRPVKEIPCEVRTCNKSGKDELSQLGLAFIGDDPKQKQALTELLLDAF